jgi:uncharacterized protein YkwD
MSSMLRSSIIALTLLSALSAFPLAGGQGPLQAAMREHALLLINRDRAAHGLRPLQLDPIASAVAQRFSERQIADQTIGHFTLDGVPPYMRYSFAGGNDGMSENSVAWSASYDFTDSMIPDLISRSHATMMSQRPPRDGHRKALLEPHATHAGIGLAWKEGEFRLTEIFVRRNIRWTREIPRVARLSDRLVVSGQVREGLSVRAASVYFEPFPRPMKREVVNALEDYALPKNRRDFPVEDSLSQSVFVRIAGGDPAPGRLHLRGNTSFSFGVPFDRGPGVYTVAIWLVAAGSDQPTMASNISIRVDPDSGDGR